MKKNSVWISIHLFVLLFLALTSFFARTGMATATPSFPDSTTTNELSRINLCPITIYMLSYDVTCDGGADGSTDITVTPTVPPYFFQWSNGSITSDINNLPAGYYCVTVTDNAGCTAEACESVFQPPPMNIGMGVTDPSSPNANDGAISGFLTGGTPPTSYQWSTGASSYQIFQLGVGTYCLTITDSNGCSATSCTTLSAQAIQVEIEGPEQLCVNECGSYVALEFAGTQICEYIWSFQGQILSSNNSFDFCPQGFAGSDYLTLSVIDCFGEQAVVTQYVEIISTYPLEIVSTSPASCPDNDDDAACDKTCANSTITYTVPGSQGLDLEWSVVAAESYEVDNNLLTVTWGNPGVGEITVHSGTPAGGLEVHCTPLSGAAQGSPGSGTAFAIGGTPPYTYAWCNGATSPTVSGIAANSACSVTISDSEGNTGTCELLIPAMSPNCSSGFELQNYTINNLSCPGSNDGSISLLIVGGTSNSYLWSNGSTSPTISGLSAGIYYVTVTNINNPDCENVYCFPVQEPEAMIANAYLITPPSSNNNNNGAAGVQVIGGSGPYTYQWNNGANSQPIFNLSAGSYSVTVTDIYGCTVVSSVTVEANDLCPANVYITINELPSNCYQADGILMANINITNPPNPGPVAYLWDNNATTSVASGLQAGTHCVTITNANGCTATDCIDIPCDVSIPATCSGEGSLCIDIIPEPNAVIKATPVAVNGVVTLCKGETIVFENASTDAGNYVWELGDGYSTAAEELTYAYAESGVYTVLLIARNECFCIDTTSLIIAVSDAEIPDILCTGTTCANNEQTYSTSADCTTFIWTLSANGTITAGGGPSDNFVSVYWNNGPTGTVSVQVMNCNGNYCDKPTTEIIPIIQDGTPITGPAKICPGDVVNYALPLWTGTAYNWTIADGGEIKSGQFTNTITVKWDIPSGTNPPLWVHATYDNCFLDCGGESHKEVAITPEYYLTGSIEVCENSSSTYAAFDALLNNPVLCNWVVRNPAGAEVWTASGQNSVDVPWPLSPGRYELVASPVDPNAFCNNAYTIFVQVNAGPPALTSIDGLNAICPGETQTYTAEANQGNVSYFWQINNGGILTEKTGTTINVQWGFNPPYELTLTQLSNTGLACESLPFTMVIQAISTIGLNGSTAICVESTQSYTANAAGNATYEWLINPSDAGTLLEGQGTNAIEVLWHAAGMANISVSLCGVIENLAVNVSGFPGPQVLHPAILCPGETGAVSTAQTYTSYSWRDENGAVLSTLPNPNLSPGYYNLVVTNSTGCEGQSSFEIAAYPLPEGSISHPGFNWYCVAAGFPIQTLYALNTEDGYTYEWFNNSTALNIFTETYTPTGPGNYRVQVTDGNGCTNFSNTINVYENCGSGGGPPAPGINCPDVSNVFTTGLDCHHGLFQNTSTGYVPGSIVWNFGDPASGANNTSTLENPEHIFSNAGFYNVLMFATSPSGATCAIFKPFEVKLKADFDAQYACPGLPAVFKDISRLTPGTTITDWLWDFGDPASGANNTATIEAPTHVYDNVGNYEVSLTVTAETGCTSTITKTVSVLAPPSADFATPNNSCEATALPFVANLPSDVLSSSWDFGDPASGAANTAISTSTFHAFSSAGIFDVTLSFSNVYGCSNSFTLPVNVDANGLSGDITMLPSSPICEGNSTTVTAPPGGVTWLWAGGQMTANITIAEAGVYEVTITDSYGCTYSPPDAVLDVIPNPEGAIKVTEYNEFGQPADCFFDGYVLCEGEDVFLSISGAGDYSYSWSYGGSGTTVTFDEEHNNNLTAGTYDFTVTITDNVSGCTNVEGPYTIVVNPVPTDINIASTPPGPICEGTTALFEVSNVDPALTYLWSTGEYGTAITASTAGEYFVRGISQFGCEGESNTLEIYRSPDANLIPDGCHTHCLPDTICLPEMPDVVNYQWYLDDNPIAAPNGTVADLMPLESGAYRVELFDVHGCYAASDAFDLTLLPFSTDSLTLSDCVGGQITYAGEVLLPGTTTDFVLTNFRGCDSIVTVTALENISYTIDEVIGTCDGTPVLYNGLWYDAGASAILNYSTALGCDSIIQLEVLFWPTYAMTDTLYSCTNEPVLYMGEELYPGSTTNFPMLTVQGCDSIMTIVVLAAPSYTETIALSGCEGETVIYDGVAYSAGTQQVLNYPSTTGCDSVITLNIAALPVTETAVALSTCAGTTTEYNGDDLAPGVYEYIFESQTGCDSLVEVTVGSLSSFYETLELSACEGGTVSYGGQEYAAGSQLDLNYETYQGCDSVIALTVSELVVPLTTVVLDICATDSLAYGATFLHPGTTTEFVFESANGCDSIVIISLEAYPEFDFTISAPDILCWNDASGEILIEAVTGGTAPFSYAYDQGSFQLDTLLTGIGSGQHFIYVQDAHGCVEEQALAISAIPPLEVLLEAPILPCQADSIVVEAQLLRGGTDSMLYHWQHGVHGNQIAIYNPGTYTLEVTNLCETRRFNLEVMLGHQIGAGYFYIPNSFSPNGDGVNDVFTAFAANDVEVLSYELHLFDRWGNALYETTDLTKGWDGQMNEERLNVGVYVWWLRAEVLVCGRERVSVFEKGDVTIFR